jgi:LytS/YehU family sensor histidine kinase
LIDKNVNPELVKVLPMIIQIPVENAMKHALRPKTGHKELLVSISEREDAIVIKIQDNGAGYQPNTLNTKGTGTGLKVIYQTIEILNTRNKEKIKFSIHSNGASESGTEVQIHIPLNYNFSL